MVQLVKQRLKSPAQVSEVHYPAGFLTDRPADVNLDSKRVAVQACALMPIGNVGQQVSCLDLKNAKNIHRQIVPPPEFPRNRSACLESRPGVRSITKRLARRLATATERSAHLDAFLTELIMHSQAPPERDWAVFDH